MPQDLLCAAYYLEAAALFQQLAEAGMARMGPAAGELKDDPQASALPALIQLLGALAAHQQAPNGPASLTNLAAKVKQHCPLVFRTLPDIATDAVIALWHASSSFLQAAVGSADVGTQQATEVSPLPYSFCFCTTLLHTLK